MAEREANTTPAREICPPTVAGFERLAAIAMMASIKRSNK